MAMQWHFLSYLPVITTVCGLLTVYVSTVIFYVSHDTATYHRDEGMGMIRSLSDASSRAPEYNFFAPLAALTAYLGFTCSVLGGMLIWDCCPAAVPCCDLLLLRLVVLAYWVLGALWAIGVYGVGFVSSAADSEQHPENQAHFIFFGLFFICYISQSLLYLGVLRRASTKGLVRFPLVRQVFSLFCLVAACSCLIGFLMSPNQSSIQGVMEYLMLTAMLFCFWGLSGPFANTPSSICFSGDQYPAQHPENYQLHDLLYQPKPQDEPLSPFSVGPPSPVTNEEGAAEAVHTGLTASEKTYVLQQCSEGLVRRRSVDFLTRQCSADFTRRRSVDLSVSISDDPSTW